MPWILAYYESIPASHTSCPATCEKVPTLTSWSFVGTVSEALGPHLGTSHIPRFWIGGSVTQTDYTLLSAHNGAEQNTATSQILHYFCYTSELLETLAKPVHLLHVSHSNSLHIDFQEFSGCNTPWNLTAQYQHYCCPCYLTRNWSYLRRWRFSFMSNSGNNSLPNGFPQIGPRYSHVSPHSCRI